MARQARIVIAVQNGKGTWQGHSPDSFFALTVLCKTSPQVLQLLLKLDQSLCGEIRSHMGDSETKLSEATQRPFWEQIFRQQVQADDGPGAPGKALPVINSHLLPLESCSRVDYHRRGSAR